MEHLEAGGLGTNGSVLKIKTSKGKEVIVEQVKEEKQPESAIEKVQEEKAKDKSVPGGTNHLLLTSSRKKATNCPWNLRTHYLS